LRGWMAGRAPSLSNSLLRLLAMIVADLQLVVGLLLYVLWSPRAAQARADFGAAMKDPELRFWAVEHGTAMILTIVCVHLGKLLVQRATTDASRQRRTVLYFGLALALILYASPWPFSAIPRPWWRLGAP
jgi:hypothetical protein